MYRSILVILLAVVCGVSAAIGVNQLTPRTQVSKSPTQVVFVAAKAIRRGEVVAEESLKPVDWPVELVPPGLIADRTKIVGRSALASISPGEPLFQSKLTGASGSGLVTNSIPKGMRACTIRTTGPSASVAGFVRPGDRVDVVLNLRSSNNDESGGGSAVTLLQAVEILAIDNQLEVSSAAESLKNWIKEGLASVTLLVTPEQAMQLSLGQASGTLSLALRRGDDKEVFEAPPVTVRQIREFQDSIARASHSEDQTPPDVAPSENDPPPASPSTVTQATASQVTASQSPPPPTYIRTLRGDQSGFVRVVKMAESNP